MSSNGIWTNVWTKQLKHTQPHKQRK
jgi:hypothetical protein